MAGPKRSGEMDPLWNVEAADADVLEADALEFDPEELGEFLAGDLMPSSASPEFRERLRADLWTMVDVRYGRNRGAKRGGGSA